MELSFEATKIRHLYNVVETLYPDIHYKAVLLSTERSQAAVPIYAIINKIYSHLERREVFKIFVEKK